MTTFTAEVIADTVNPYGGRITTLKLRYPRFIHAEFLTHRMFSRNSQSNRAVAFRDVVEDVLRDTAVPIYWGKEQKGMVASEEVLESYWCEQDWLDARDQAIKYAARLHEELGVHKQLCNRLLEPFQHINTLVTATEWDNFFSLRLAPDAEPHMQRLAEAMKTALDNSVPNNNIIHLPFVVEEALLKSTKWDAMYISAARCARVSYNNHGKAYPIEKELEFAFKLKSHKHMSPFEHAAYFQGSYMNANFSEYWCSFRHYIEKYAD